MRSGPRTPYGPLAPTGRLTSEGQAFVAEWLDRWPNPGRVLRNKYPGLWGFAASRFGVAAVNATCVSAAAVAALTYMPQVDAPWVFFEYWRRGMRNAVKELLYFSRLCDRDTRAIPLNDPRRPGCLAMANSVPVCRRRIVGVSIDDFEAALRWLPNARDRAIVRRHLVRGASLAAVAADYGLSKQRVQQIVAGGRAVLRQKLRGVL